MHCLECDINGETIYVMGGKQKNKKQKNNWSYFWNIRNNDF